jgi:hypothetical protein
MDIYMMFRRLILSFGETGALFASIGIEGKAYCADNCLDAGLVAALADRGTGSFGSASEWKGGRDRCGTPVGADRGIEW